MAITCAAADAMSGLASNTCADVGGDAYDFVLGTNSFSATATDVAGNTASETTSFNVSVTRVDNQSVAPGVEPASGAGMKTGEEEMMRPLIAVTTTHGAAGRRKVPHVLLNAQYVEAVERPGATAVLLTPLHAAASVECVLDVVHGLVLTGGEDVDPVRYGQEPHAALGGVNAARDDVEFAALAGALQRGMPVFAICRGMQLLNVALGGTLFQDLPSQLGGDILHEQTAPINERWHRARIRTDSRLGEVMGMEELRINSFHHQGVDRLAPGLEASVWAEDGLVEGVESTEHPWMMGVQWHPERGEAEAWNDPRDPNRRLFWAFVEAARDWSVVHASGV